MTDSNPGLIIDSLVQPQSLFKPGGNGGEGGSEERKEEEVGNDERKERG